MIDELGDKSVGVKFMDDAFKVIGDYAAIAHTEWAHLVGIAGKMGVRQFKQLVQNGMVSVHQSVLDRKALKAFSQYLGAPASRYNPTNY